MDFPDRDPEDDLSDEASANDVSVGEWHHVVGTYDGGTMTLYLDGTDVDSTQSDKDVKPHEHVFRIGGDTAQQTYGFVDEVAIYAEVLSPQDVAEHYSFGSL
jgi:hypothetical protein